MSLSGHTSEDVLLVHELQYQAQLQIQRQVLVSLWVKEACNHSFPLNNM